MEVFVIVVLIGLLPATIAQGKGRSFVLWWIYGSALFIVALPHALLISTNKAELEWAQLAQGEMKKCPDCAELVKREANVCRYCGRNFNAALPDELRPSETPPSDMQQMEKYGIIFSHGSYVYGEYKYDKLSQAVNYAELEKKRSV